jgi:hypothetical protein
MGKEERERIISMTVEKGEHQNKNKKKMQD